MIAAAEGRKVYNKSVHYLQYLFSCELPVVHPIPTHVSLVANKCGKTTTLLPVQVPARGNPWLDEFAVCVCTVYGSFPPEMVVEWIEANRLFGVMRFHIYDTYLTNNETVKALEYYVRKNVVMLHKMPPSVFDFGYFAIKLATPLSYNDCVLRSMYSARFLVVIDFDELIVPRLHDNYNDMIR